MKHLLSGSCLMASAWLSGCIGIDLPDPAPYIASCPPPVDAPEGAPDALFFMSTGLPDCRSGELSFARLRHAQPTFGISEPTSDSGPEDEREFRSTRYGEGTWTSSLQQRLSAGHNNGRVLVYIHGYNTDFEYAVNSAWRISQVSFDGVPIVVLRWPSRANAADYIFDEGSVAWSQQQIDRTITMLAQLDAQITIVAHSMGARAAIGAVDHLHQNQPELAANVASVVLASPDFDRSLAMREGGAIDRLLQGGRRVLVYASARDVPLALSRDAHGYARLGSSNCRHDVDYEDRIRAKGELCHLTAPRDGLAMVDTSQVASDTLFRHSDYLDSCAVRADLTAFLREADEFPLRERIERDGKLGYRITAELATQFADCEEPDSAAS